MDEELEQLRSSGATSEVTTAFLLADSRPLFGTVGEGSFADYVAASLRDTAWTGRPRAAYLGAGTGDLPEYYGIFEAFAEAVGCKELCHVHASPTDEERSFLATADLVVLGGGDVLVAWRAFEEARLVEPLRQSFLSGAVHIGVSAGATLLGLGTLDDRGEVVPLLGMVPLAVMTGGSEREEELKRLVRHVALGRGIAIPLGAGAIYHSDGSLEPISSSLSEVHRDEDGQLRLSHLLPLDEPSSPGGSEHLS